jgi:hypothetical protein
MSQKTDFKSIVSGIVYSINLKLNSKISVLYPDIKSQLLSMLGCENMSYVIVLKTLNFEILEESSDECFANFCDSVNYPALYFKLIVPDNAISEVD